jgi:hypothetical protein
VIGAKEPIRGHTISLEIGHALIVVHKSLAAKMLVSNVALGGQQHHLLLQHLPPHKAELEIGHVRIVVISFSQVKADALSVEQASQPSTPRHQQFFQCRQGEDQVIGRAPSATTMFMLATSPAGCVVQQCLSLGQCRTVGRVEKFKLRELRCGQEIGVAQHVAMCSLRKMRSAVNVGKLDRSGLEVR